MTTMNWRACSEPPSGSSLRIMYELHHDEEKHLTYVLPSNQFKKAMLDKGQKEKETEVVVLLTRMLTSEGGGTKDDLCLMLVIDQKEEVRDEPMTHFALLFHSDPVLSRRRVQFDPSISHILLPLIPFD